MDQLLIKNVGEDRQKTKDTKKRQKKKFRPLSESLKRFTKIQTMDQLSKKNVSVKKQGSG